MDFRKECEVLGIKKHGEIAWRKMVEKTKKICAEYNLASCAEALLTGGLDQVFDKNGNVIDGSMSIAIEHGKGWAFGDAWKESSWVAHIGD